MTFKKKWKEYVVQTVSECMVGNVFHHEYDISLKLDSKATHSSDMGYQSQGKMYYEIVKEAETIMLLFMRKSMCEHGVRLKACRQRKSKLFTAYCLMISSLVVLFLSTQF